MPRIARAKGFLLVSATPLTRSSYHADADFAAAAGGAGGAAAARLGCRRTPKSQLVPVPARAAVRPGRRCRPLSRIPALVHRRAREQPHREPSWSPILTIGFGPFRESFTSRVTLDRPHRIRVRYENGPFRYLNNRWAFAPDPARLQGRFLRRFRIPQPPPAGGDRRGVQRGGAAHGERVPSARAQVYGPPPATLSIRRRGRCRRRRREHDLARLVPRPPPS